MTKRTHRLESIESSTEYQYLADSLVLDHYSTPKDVLDLLKASFFGLHNESLNAWSHFMGGTYFLLESFKQTQLAPFVYCVCATFCFLSSGLCHFTTGFGERAYDMFGRLDYAGISVLTWGTTTSVSLQVFEPEDPRLKTIVAWTTAIAGITLSSAVLNVRSKVIRVTLYALAGSCTLIPLVIRREHPFAQRYVKETFISMLLCYLIGLTFYLWRIPERWFPGKFDLIFSSHHFWHVAVWLASFIHFQSLV